MPKKELQVKKINHVRELAKARGWEEFSDFLREAQYHVKMARGTAEKAWRGDVNLGESAVVKLAILFGVSEPYKDVLEIRMQ